MNWNEKTILVTGGTGSFGKKFVKIMLDEYRPAKMIIYSRDELKQHEMRAAGFDHPNLRYFIGDVRDLPRLRRAMQGVDIVVHAAALKQVPACEYNPMEAVKTNILGTSNVVDAAIDARVEKVLFLSTDKAVTPVNLYGATKLTAEKLVVASNAYAGDMYTRLSCVRYGNVVGSRGSVVPIFIRQREQGNKLTITDDRMTRFWLSLEQGVRFVISNLERMHGGEVFVPKIPSTKIVDLARAIAPSAEIDVIGIRPGEKLHEMMISRDESRTTIELEDRFVVEPFGHLWFRYDWSKEGKRVPDGFKYTSDNNTEWLTEQQIRELVAPFEADYANGNL
ncbi:MAG TPA: UDP-N-acetylglucosamine 4,6-dehydratase (inverting) [Anaerolineales bacterium]|nr:UDP-N-acetylglucosamine 4,6-dehydratase (inverting) [Anaerolineales bacterium]